jgi:hypothetical protein
MPATFIAILTAHLLGDFILQPAWMIERKRQVLILALHAAVVAMASYLLLGTFHSAILLVIFLTHFCFDAIKIYLLSNSLGPFLSDQFMHLAVLVGLAVYFPDASSNGWWMVSLPPDLSKWYFASLAVVSGLILCVPAGGILIAKLIEIFAAEIRDSNLTGLKQGGLYIGWLERILVMLLLLIDQPNGIGFLIAAKSILRFGEIKDASQRKVAEYIIIGTFLSFGWALLISALTQKAIRYWLS